MSEKYLGSKKVISMKYYMDKKLRKEFIKDYLENGYSLSEDSLNNLSPKERLNHLELFLLNKRLSILSPEDRIMQSLVYSPFKKSNLSKCSNFQCSDSQYLDLETVMGDWTESQL